MAFGHVRFLHDLHLGCRSGIRAGEHHRARAVSGSFTIYISDAGRVQVPVSMIAQ
jgi:hypothetical protein